LEGGGGLSVIAEKFERNAHIVPNAEGAFGASVGSYTIETRLPTSIAGNIQHLLVPGDMVEEAALFAFGIGDILSIATGALQAVGGPLATAAISAGRAIFGAIQNIGGSKADKNKTESANPPALSGSLDISRFVEFLKPILQNEEADPTFPSLLIKAKDFIGGDGGDITDIPARVWAKMGTAGIERQLWDRLVTPATSMENELYIPRDRFAYMVDRFGAHPNTFKKGTLQNTCFVKFIAQVRKHGMKSGRKSITLKSVMDYEPTQPEVEYADQILFNHASIYGMP
jgi:hypothetical protein